MNKVVLFVVCFMSFYASYLSGQLSCGGPNTFNFNYTGTPQTWVVPVDVTTIRIEAIGASGGLSTAVGLSAGGGATIEGEYNVNPGDVVTVLVGQAGGNGDQEAGGGGSSGVYIGPTLYIVAGGGGGEDNTGNGGIAVVGNNGTDGLPVFASGNCIGPQQHINDSRGGIGGAGGFQGDICDIYSLGAGGGGLNSSGGNGTDIASATGGGQGSITGGSGGQSGLSVPPLNGLGAVGGWGWSGGGGAFERASGGGGGYSGGAGAGNSGRPGGGGSFILPGFINSFTSNGSFTTTKLDGMVTICYELEVLPLTLISFVADLEAGCVSLKWRTAQEINVSKFSIERSEDGINFNTVGVVPATNTTNLYNYNFKDCSATNKDRWFYRLKITDQDGSNSYSSIAVIKNKLVASVFSVYPSPASDHVFLNTDEAINKIEIFDETGLLQLAQTNVEVSEPVLINDLYSGIYILKAYTDREVFVSKFIKY